MIYGKRQVIDEICSDIGEEGYRIRLLNEKTVETVVLLLSHLLDYLLDFACDEKILGLYKKVCRRYLYVYPGCIKFYIEAYREMWEDENK